MDFLPPFQRRVGRVLKMLQYAVVKLAGRNDKIRLTRMATSPSPCRKFSVSSSALFCTAVRTTIASALSALKNS